MTEAPEVGATNEVVCEEREMRNGDDSSVE